MQKDLAHSIKKEKKTVQEKRKMAKARNGGKMKRRVD